MSEIISNMPEETDANRDVEKTDDSVIIEQMIEKLTPEARWMLDKMLDGKGDLSAEDLFTFYVSYRGGYGPEWNHLHAWYSTFHIGIESASTYRDHSPGHPGVRDAEHIARVWGKQVIENIAGFIAYASLDPRELAHILSEFDKIAKKISRVKIDLDVWHKIDTKCRPQSIKYLDNLRKAIIVLISMAKLNPEKYFARFLLLRPAEPPEGAGGETLLRPAGGVNGDDSDQLLRPSDKPEGNNNE